MPLTTLQLTRSRLQKLGFRFHRREIGFTGGRSFSDPNSTTNHNLLVYHANSEEQQGGEMYSAAAILGIEMLTKKHSLVRGLYELHMTWGLLEQE